MMSFFFIEIINHKILIKKKPAPSQKIIRNDTSLGTLT
jgi:hypothetical protein